MALNRWAYDAKRIPGSLHFDTPDELYAALKPDDEIVVYCSHTDCLSSVALYRDLLRRGYRNVRRYAGGLLDWEDSGTAARGIVRRAARMTAGDRIQATAASDATDASDPPDVPGARTSTRSSPSARAGTS